MNRAALNAKSNALQNGTLPDLSGESLEYREKYIEVYYQVLSESTQEQREMNRAAQNARRNALKNRTLPDLSEESLEYREKYIEVYHQVLSESTQEQREIYRVTQNNSSRNSNTLKKRKLSELSEENAVSLNEEPIQAAKKARTISSTTPTTITTSISHPNNANGAYFNAVPVSPLIQQSNYPRAPATPNTMAAAHQLMQLAATPNKKIQS